MGCAPYSYQLSIAKHHSSGSQTPSKGRAKALAGNSLFEFIKVVQKRIFIEFSIINEIRSTLQIGVAQKKILIARDQRLRSEQPCPTVYDGNAIDDVSVPCRRDQSQRIGERLHHHAQRVGGGCSSAKWDYQKRAVLHTPDRKRLPEIFFVRIQANDGGYVDQTRKPEGGVDQKSSRVAGRPPGLTLQQLIDRNRWCANVSKNVANKAPGEIRKQPLIAFCQRF